MAPWIATVMSQKGGVGKTASAIHIAGHLSAMGKRTLLLDGDPAQFALRWLRAQDGPNPDVPFDTLPLETGMEVMDDYEAVVLDMRGGQPAEEVAALGDLSSVIVLPCVPEFMSVNGMADTVDVLKEAGVPMEKTRVLLTMDIKAGSATTNARRDLTAFGFRVLERSIRNTNAFRHAADAGKFVHRMPGVASKMASDDYRAVTRELLAVGA